MREAEATLPTLRLVLPHPVPLLARKPRGAFVIVDDEGGTEVAVRGVPANALRELRLAAARCKDDVLVPAVTARTAYRFEDRLWLPLTGVSAQLAKMGKAARAGEAPFRIRYGLHDAGAPYRLDVAPHLSERYGFLRRPIPDRLRQAVVLDLAVAAGERMRALSSDLLHAGGVLYRAVAPPALFGVGKPHTELAAKVSTLTLGMVHPARTDYALPYARLDAFEAYAEALGLRGTPLAELRAVAGVGAEAVAGIDPGDADVDAFVNAAPSELLDMLRQGSPGRDLTQVGVVLWPWAARGAIAAIRGAERGEALHDVRRVAEAMAQVHPTPRHRNRCALLVRYVDWVARPRVDATRAVPEDDALSLDRLRPGP